MDDVANNLETTELNAAPSCTWVVEDVADELAAELYPVVYRAAGAVLRTRQHLTHHFDDLVGEGFLVLAQIIDKVRAGRVINKLPGYTFRSCRRAMVRYLERQGK